MDILISFLNNHYSEIIAIIMGIIGWGTMGREHTKDKVMLLLHEARHELALAVEGNHDVYSEYVFDHIPTKMKPFVTQNMVDVLIVEFAKLVDIG